MHVVSTNIGARTSITLRGAERDTGIFKRQVDSPISLRHEDVEGDAVVDRRYHGGPDKACYLYSADHYSFWKDQYPDLDWHWGIFGENLTVLGLDESELRIGDIFDVGSARIQVSQPRQPCSTLGARFGDNTIVKKFIEAEKPGAYVRVLTEGDVKAGDELLPEQLKPDNPSLRTVFHLLYHAKDDLAATRKAAEIAELAESCRKDLIKFSTR